MDSDAQEKKSKIVSLILITFRSCFLSIIYARDSYLAIDLATETATYTYICIYQHTYLHRRTFNVQPSCFFFSSSCLLSTRARRQCAYASSGCDQEKITLYRNFFRNLNFKNIVKTICCSLYIQSILDDIAASYFLYMRSIYLKNDHVSKREK